MYTYILEIHMHIHINISLPFYPFPIPEDHVQLPTLLLLLGHIVWMCVQAV
jgi:hypothetical protein